MHLFHLLQGFLMATAGFLSVSRSVLRPGEAVASA